MNELKKIIEERHDFCCIQCGSLMKRDKHNINRHSVYFSCLVCGYANLFDLMPAFFSGLQRDKKQVLN